MQRADLNADAGAVREPATAAPRDRFATEQMRPPGSQPQRDAAGDPWQAAQARPRAPEGAWTGPRPLAPEARAAGAGPDPAAPASAHAWTDAAPPPVNPAAADIPAWLSERMREDAEQDSRRQRSRLASRRALGWSAAVTVVAMLAVGAYWFYQDSRVEGALNVVANTNPAAPATLASPRAGRQTAVLAAPVAAAPGSTAPGATALGSTTPAAAAPASAAPPSAATSSAAPASAAPPSAGATAPDNPTVTPSAALDRGASPPATGATAPEAGAGAAPGNAQAPAEANGAAPALPAPGASRRGARTQHLANTGGSLDNIDHPLRPSAPVTHRRRHSPAETRARASADSEPTPAQRQEETLMQCRALGYDARECARRGCMMTRFGLACPG